MKVEFQHTMKRSCIDVDVTATVGSRTDNVLLESVVLGGEVDLVTVLPTRLRKEIADAARKVADDLWGDAA